MRERGEEYVDMLTYYLRRFGKVCPSRISKLCPVKVEYGGGVKIDDRGAQLFGEYKCPACENELTSFQLPANYLNDGVGFCPYCDQTIINPITLLSLFEKEKDKMYSDFFRSWCRNYNKDTWLI